jgi:hypothetical protein
MNYYRQPIEIFFNTGLDDGFYAIPDNVPLDDNEKPIFLYADCEEAPEGWVYLDDDEDTAERMLALRISEDDFDSDFTYVDGSTLTLGKREYLVVTDEEADELWDQDLDHYLEECVLHELPEAAQMYFDREKWKRDARMDGRGHSLNRYDGNEESEDIGGVTYYIYRQS